MKIPWRALALTLAAIDAALAVIGKHLIDEVIPK